MGGIERRIQDLERSREARDPDEDLRRQRAITRMILDEFARLKASGELSAGDPLAQVVHNVAAEQYPDLDFHYIADGWIETLREWTRLDWLVTTGREGPPRA